MRRREGIKAVGLLAALAATVLLGAWGARGQNPPPAPGAGAGATPGAGAAPGADAKGKAARKGPLRGRAPAREPAKGVRKGVVDPLADPAANPNAPGGGAGGANANPNANPGIDPNGPLPELGTYHYRFKISAAGSDAIQATYYPSKLLTAAPAVLLVHERDRSSKDFEDSLGELKGLSLAESLQKAGFGVMAVDLHGHGGNPRRALSPRDWAALPNDLELAYLALVDRHNRGELNLAKLGVVALGEGANVAAAWAAGGGGVSSEGRAGDLNALVLISPMGDAASQGLRATGNLTTLAPRVPIALMVGERDAPSFELVNAVQPIVKRYRLNQVDTFPSALHGYQLLRLEPNLTGAITKFLEATIKAKADEWEGRYLLDPVRFGDVKILPNPVRPGDAAAKKAVPR